MYKKGNVQIGQSEADLVDGINENGNWVSEKIRGKVYLPHSCSEWVIGGLPEVSQLIADLQEIEKKLDKK